MKVTGNNFRTKLFRHLKVVEAKVLSAALNTLVDFLLPGVELAVTFEVAAGGEPLAAHYAEVRLHAGVPYHVGGQVGFLHVGFVAEGASVRLLIAVKHAMLLEGVLGGKPARTLVTLQVGAIDARRRVLVPHVGIEVRVLAEGLSAYGAGEGFISSVGHCKM